MGRAAAAGQADTVRAETVPGVAAQFDSIAATIAQLAPRLKGATVTVRDIYALHAVDAKPAPTGASGSGASGSGATSAAAPAATPAAAPIPEAQFFCSVPGAELLVTVTLSDLPPGEYAAAVVHATGVEHPEQFALILEKTASGWKLAGFSAREMTQAGHDGLWYWTQARAYARRQERWSAYFYYEAAEYLLNPADYFVSPNLQKLEKESAAVRPEGLPGKEPMTLAAGDSVFTITGLRTDGSLGGLDLVIDEKVDSVADPVATRASILALMQAVLAQHPELRTSFHGLWVYASAPGSAPFAVELPMAQIPVS